MLIFAYVFLLFFLYRIVDFTFYAEFIFFLV